MSSNLHSHSTFEKCRTRSLQNIFDGFLVSNKNEKTSWRGQYNLQTDFKTGRLMAHKLL